MYSTVYCTYYLRIPVAMNSVMNIGATGAMCEYLNVGHYIPSAYTPFYLPLFLL